MGRKGDLTPYEQGFIDAKKEDNWSNRQIAGRLGRDRRCIDRYVLRRDLGKPASTCRALCGRKRKTSVREDRTILREVTRKRAKRATTISRDLQAQGMLVSARTIVNRLHEFGFTTHRACKKPYINAVNRRKRVRWCKQRIHWTKAQWRRVVWSDESPFVLMWQGCKLVWRRVGERYHPDCMMGTVKHDKKIMVWSCFSKKGVGPFRRIHGRMNKRMYREILKNWGIRHVRHDLGPGFIWQQDNDPKHTSHVVRAYLEGRERAGELEVLDWPSQSPDLNPIESLWKILDDAARDRHPSTEAKLFEILESEWKKISVSQLLRLVDSMPRRCQAVIDACGFPTKY